MKKNLLYFCTLFVLVICSCGDDEEKNPTSPLPLDDISESIIGEWVYEDTQEGAWQSMKFTESGSFYYSENKEEWSNTLKTVGGRYSLNGKNVSGYRVVGSLYVDMSIKEIDDYSFVTRYKNSGIDVVFHKVLLRSHLNFAESVTPSYAELINQEVIRYQSHQDSIATVDPQTGEITAVARKGRTYIDVTTSKGTACIKVMVGDVDDGDEKEISTIPSKKNPIISNDVVDVAKTLIGPLWVYDHPEEKLWEVIRFLDNGKLYFSNREGISNVENEDAYGNFQINQKTISGTVYPNASSRFDFYWVVTNITDLEFTVKVFSSGVYDGRFTYAKQIGSISIDLTSSETIVPDYQGLVGNGRTIIGYKSHRPDIAEVDGSTGFIKANVGGHTYVDVMTDKGTAVVEVTIKNPILLYNFDEFVWSSRNKVDEQFGNLPSTIDGDNTIFELSKGDFKSAMFTFDHDIVSRITLLPKDNVSFTGAEMINVLNERYTPYPSMTTNNRKTFINGSTEEDSNVIIVYYLQTKQLLFVQLEK